MLSVAKHLVGYAMFFGFLALLGMTKNVREDMTACDGKTIFDYKKSGKTEGGDGNVVNRLNFFTNRKRLP